MRLYISKEENASGKNIVTDDMILTKGLPTSAGSKMLDGYNSLFEATVVTKLAENGYCVSGKANTGEMNIDLLGETSYYGACTDEQGKLNNACAEIVKADEAQAAVVLDVNGVPARAAATSGLVYIKPTYGTVSRFGTIPGACSGETVGVMAKSAAKCREVLSVMAGHDDNDGTSLPEEKCALLKADAERKAVKKIAVVKAMVNDVDSDVTAKIDAFKAEAQEKGIEVVEIDGKELLLAKPAWNILMSAEVCNNVSRYDGVKYGYRAKEYSDIDELYTNSRTEAFGYLLKSTILFGSETLSTDNYFRVYDKALRMRRVISEYLEEVLKEYDAILLPACSKSEYNADEVIADSTTAYKESVFTAPALISGLPAVTVNGIQLVGNMFAENSLLDVAELFEKEGDK